MALTLGELSGTLGLDAGAFDKALAGAQGNLEGFGAKGAVIAGAAGVAVGAALAAGVIGAMDIEKGNDKLAAQLGLNEKQSEASGKAAGSLYANAYGESLEEVNGAVGAVMSSISGMRDASSADIEAMTAKALDLATAMEVDVGRAAQVAGQMVSSGLAKDADEAFDLLMVSLQRVPAAVREDILDATDEYGPFFAQVGISGDKAMGMLVAASEKGMYGIDKTGDAVAEFSKRAGNISDTGAQEALEGIGLSGEDMARKITQGGDVSGEAFDQIISHLLGVEDPAAQAAAAVALFGTPLEDLSAQDIPKFLESLSSTETGLGDVSGAMEKWGGVLNDNASTNLEGFKRGLTTTFVDIVGGRVIPAIQDAASYLATTLGPAIQDTARFLNDQALPALSAFGQWFTDNQSTIGLIAGVIGTLLIPVFVRLAIQAGVSAAAQVTAWALSSGGAIKAAAVYLIQSYVIIGRWVAMGVAAVVSGAQTVAIWALYKLEAIKGAAVYVAQSLRVAAAWVAMSTAAVISGAKTRAVWVATVVASAVSSAAAFIVQSARVVGGWVLMGTQSLIQAARMAAAWFIALGPIGWVIAAVVGLVALIIANWETVSRVTSDIFNKVWDFLKGVWSNIVAWVLQAAVNIVSTIRNKFTEARNTATSIFNAVVDFVRGIPGRVVSALSAMANLARTVGDWITSVRDGAVDRFLSLVDWVRGVPDRIVSALGNLGGLLLSAGGQIMSGFLQGLKDSWGAVTDFIGGIGQWIADNKGPKRYDQQLLVPAGKWIMGGLNKSMKSRIPHLKRTLGDVAGLISGMDPSISVSGNGRLGAISDPGYAGHGGSSPSPTIQGGERVVNVNYHSYNPVGKSDSQTIEDSSSHLAAAIGL